MITRWLNDAMTNTAAAATTPEREDTRSDGPMTGTTKEIIDHWLELYRQTVLLKIGGLTSAQLCESSAPPSGLSLIGVVRHLTEVEAYWIREVMLGDPDVPNYYSTREDPEGDFDGASPETAFTDIARYEQEIAEIRSILAQWDDLETVAKGQRHGKAVNLAWILTHLIEEYARHLGHMDLLRERIDGRAGY